MSGFYLRITPDQVGIGVGAHSFDKDRLATFRHAVVHPQAGESLQQAVTALERARFAVKGEHYKQLPRGFDTDDAFATRMLRYAALWVGEDEPTPKSLHSKRFVSWAMTRWSKQAPLHRWLVDNLQ